MLPWVLLLTTLAVPSPVALAAPVEEATPAEESAAEEFAQAEDEAKVEQWMQWHQGLLGRLAREGVLRRVEEHLESSKTGLTDAPALDANQVRRLRLQYLLGVGYVDELIRVYESWSPQIRRAVVQSRWNKDESSLRLGWMDSDAVILGLATAYALDAQPAKVDALLTSYDLQGSSDPMFLALSSWRHPAQEDPFDLLVTLREASLDQEPRGMLLRLLVALAQREGYAPFARQGVQHWQGMLDMERRQLTAESGVLGLPRRFPVTRTAALGRLVNLEQEIDRLEPSLPRVVLPDTTALRQQFDHLAEAQFELFVLDRSGSRALVDYRRGTTRGTLQLARQGNGWKETGSILTFSCHFPTARGKNPDSTGDVSTD